jgi:hypothetical protein
MLMHYNDQLAGHAAGALGAGFPFLDHGLAGVEMAREDLLAHIACLGRQHAVLSGKKGGSTT